MELGLSAMPGQTKALLGIILTLVLIYGLSTGIFTFIFSGLLFNAAVLYTAYNIIYYSFTTPVGDADPHKQLKSALENQLTEKESTDKDKKPTDEISGWFTIRTTFEEDSEGDQLFENKSNGDGTGKTAPDAASDKKEPHAHSQPAKKPANGGRQTLAERALDTYRSFSKTAAAASSAPRNYYLARLKGTVLFIYRAPEGYKPGSAVPEKDDPSFECLGAVSIDQHLVSVEDKHGPYQGIEGRYFNKRNAIVLRPLKSKDGKRTKGMPFVAKSMTMADMSLEETAEQEPKSIYMFCKNNSLAEDMYFALLRVSAKPAKYEKIFSRPHLKWLIDEVSGMTDPSGLGWFNAIAGRIFLGINQTALVEHFIIDKINKKLALAKHPLIKSLKATEANVGHIPPLFSNAMLKRTELDGEIAFQAHMNYRQAPDLPGSGIRITIEADVGINIVLSVRIKSLSGDVEVKIKQAPTNRFWWGFVQAPDMVMEIVPVVGSRAINLTMVTNFIEKKMREGMAESIVLPNMDDIPFFSTEGMSARGGIFDEAELYTGINHNMLGVEDSSDDEVDTPPVEPAADDVLENNRLTRAETSPTMTNRMRKISAKPSPIAIRSSVASTKSTASESGSLQDDARDNARNSRDFGNKSMASSNGTPSSSLDLQREASPGSEPTTGDEASTKTGSSTPGILDAMRARDKTAFKSQANTAREGIKKWGVNFVNKRRQPTLPQAADGELEISTTPPPSGPSSYYVPSPEAAAPPARVHSGMTLQERLNAAAAAASAKPATHQRVTSSSSTNTNTNTAEITPPAPAPAIQRHKLPRGEERTMRQPAARQMVVPHVPKRPGVPTSISSAAEAAADFNGSFSPGPGPLVSSLNSTVSVPRASPAPPKVTRNDSAPEPTAAANATTVDLGSDDDMDAATPLAQRPRVRPAPSVASAASSSTLVD